MTTTIVINRPCCTDDFGRIVDGGVNDVYCFGPAAAVMSLGNFDGDYPEPITLTEFLEAEADELPDGTHVYDYLTQESATVGVDWCPEHGELADGECVFCHDEELREWAAEHRPVFA